MLEVLDSPVHFSSVFLLLQGLTLVILLLTLAEGDIHLGTSIVVNEDKCWHDGKARLLAILFQSAQFALGEKELAVAASLMIGKRAIEIRRDIHTLHPQFTLIEIAVAIYQGCLTATD